MAEVVLDRVRKVYPGGGLAVDDLSLSLPDGELLVLVGPSGCGKTTALRMIAGLEDVSGGTIRIGDRIVNELAPKDRDIAMVFQSYALYPHMTVAENLSFGLRLRKTSRAEIDRRVQHAASILGLTAYLSRKPGALSGGQRQRVAMGRAIVREPQVFLMDEPLSNLDAKLRVSMRAEIERLHERLRTTTVYVTHDQIEAMTLGDRVAVMRDGHLQQIDTPQRLYDTPVNMFVAGFIGSPSMNFAHAELLASGPTLVLGRERLTVTADLEQRYPGVAAFYNRPLIAGIRPSDFEDAAFVQDPTWPRITVTVEVTESLGSEVNVLFPLDARSVVRSDASTADHSAGEEGEGEGLSLDRATLWTARVNARTAARPGRQLTLAVNPAAFHYFDPATGHALARTEVLTGLPHA